MAAAEPLGVDQPTHTISLFVNNTPGVLVRVALVFSRRGLSAFAAGGGRTVLVVKGIPSIIIKTWRRYYNESRPHRALGYQTPQKYAASVAHQGQNSLILTGTD